MGVSDCPANSTWRRLLPRVWLLERLRSGPMEQSFRKENDQGGLGPTVWSSRLPVCMWLPSCLVLQVRESLTYILIPDIDQSHFQKGRYWRHSQMPRWSWPRGTLPSGTSQSKRQSTTTGRWPSSHSSWPCFVGWVLQPAMILLSGPKKVLSWERQSVIIRVLLCHSGQLERLGNFHL